MQLQGSNVTVETLVQSYFPPSMSISEIVAFDIPMANKKENVTNLRW